MTRRRSTLWQSSGQLQTKAALNYEAKNSYSVTVTATDTAQATNTITVTINVTNVDESPNNGNRKSNNNGGGSRSSSNNDGGSDYTPPANSPPYFRDGDTTERSVAEKSEKGTNIGGRVTAGDPDGNKLTYTLGGDDANSFSIDADAGQLKTEIDLDFEVKSTYSVSVSVSDKRGGSDSIEVAIKVTDVVEVPVTNSDTQTVVLVDPEEETAVQTPDGSAEVTFPAGSRPEPFFVRVDSNPDNCDWDSEDDLPADELQVCLTVEIFDTQGNPIEGGDVLDQPATVEFNLDAEEVGNDTIHVFTGSGAEWSQVQFTQATDHRGGISFTITGVTGFGGFAVGTKSAQQHVKSVNPPPAGKSDQQKQAGSSDSPTPTPDTYARHTYCPIPSLRRHLRSSTYAHAHAHSATSAYGYATAHAHAHTGTHAHSATRRLRLTTTPTPDGHAHTGTDA